MSYGSYSSAITKTVWSIKSIYNNTDTVYSLNITYQYAQDTSANKTKIKASIYLREYLSGWGMSGCPFYSGLGGSTSSVRSTTTTYIGSTIPGNYYGVTNYEWEVTGGGSIPISWYGYVNSADVCRPTQTSWTTLTISTPEIPQQVKSCSATATTSGGSCTVSWTQNNTAHRYKISFTMGSVSYNSGYTSAGISSYSYTMTADKWGAAIPNATSGTVNVTLYTYNGSTLLGSCSTTFTFSLASSVKPIISSITTTNIGSVTTYGYLQNYSKVKIVTSASGASGSSISNYSVSVNGQTLSGSTVTSDVLKTSGSNTISITVKDSRGRTATSTKSITVVAYSTPAINSFAASRCTSAGVSNTEGAYFHVIATTTHTALSGVSAHGTKIQYKPASSSTWSKFIPDSGSSEEYASATSYSTSSTIVQAINTETSYNVKITVYDGVQTVTRQATIGSVFVLMDFGSAGNSMAIGKTAEYANWLDVGLPTEFRGRVYIEDANVDIQNASAERYYRIVTQSGGQIRLDYDTAGNHGVWSSGYTSDSTNSDNYTSGGRWLVKRDAAGNVVVSNWASKGSYNSPIYFNENGQPAAISSLYVKNGNSIGISTTAGGNVYLSYASSGNHGLYSTGYETDRGDSSTYTSDSQWIIYRSSYGNTVIPAWKSIGGAHSPIYFSSNGLPTAISSGTGYKSIYWGTFWSTTATSISNGYGDYSMYIIGYNNYDSNVFLFFPVAKTFIGNGESNAYTFGIGSDTNYATINLYYSDTTLYLKGVARSGSTVNVRSIYGIY